MRYNNVVLIAAAILSLTIVSIKVWRVVECDRHTQRASTASTTAVGQLGGLSLAPEAADQGWLDYAPSEDPIANAPVIAVGMAKAIEQDGTSGSVRGAGTTRRVSVEIEESIRGVLVNRDIVVEFPTTAPPSAATGNQASQHEACVGLRYLLFLQPRGKSVFDTRIRDRWGPPPLALVGRTGIEDITPSDDPATVAGTVAAIAATTARSEDANRAVPAVALLGYLAGWYDTPSAKSALTHLLKSKRSETLLMAIRGISSGPRASSAMRPTFVEFSRDQRLDVAGAAIAARLRLNDPTALAAAVEWAGKRPKMPAPQVREIVQGIGGGRFSGDDAVAVKGLVTVMHSRNVEFRRSAAWVLNHIAVKSMIPDLIPMLDDSDRMVQWSVVLALFSASGGPLNTRTQGLGPGYDLFMREPDSYIARWKQWWREGAPVDIPKRGQGKNVSGFPPATLH